MKLSWRELHVLFLLFIGINIVQAQSNQDAKLKLGESESNRGAFVQNRLLMYNSSMLIDPTVCYAFDDYGNHLSSINRSTGAQTDLGESNVSTVEAVVMGWNADTIYGANAGTFGYFNNFTPTFVNIGSFGSGSGASGTKTMNDVDGLTIDPITGVFYGSQRDGDGGQPADLLFKFNHTTGQIIQDGFGTNEYVIIQPTTFSGTTYYDIDDIAIDPVDGQMYGIANQGGSVNLLVRINKTNGNTTLVARLTISGGGNMPDSEGLSFYNDGTLYLTTGTNPSRLYRINKTTAVGTLVGTFTVGYDYEGVACLTGGIVTANDDSSSGNTVGQPVSINILSNDLINNNSSTPLASEVTVDLNPGTPGNQSTLVVSGEGTWSYNSSTGVVTFTPESGFTGDPTPIPYVLTENDTGETDPATITVDYLQAPVLEITKTSSPTGEVNPGETITYTILVENTGYDAADNVTVNDVLPAGVTYTTGTTTVTYPGGTTGAKVGDDFASGNYSGFTGTNLWTGPWVETDPFGNFVFIEGGRLRMAYTYVNEESIQRTANLSTFPSAQLSFTWQTTNLGTNETMSLLISSTGGAPWTTLATFGGNTTGTFNQDISGFISATTTIRFVNQSEDWDSGQENFYFDNIVIGYTSSGNITADNSGGGNPQLDDGTPPSLVTGNDAIDLPIGESMTVTFEVTVDNGATGTLINTASANASNFSGPVNDTAENDVASYEISGTVFDDGNAGTVNGTGLGNPDGTQLYANLIDPNSNEIVASVPINSNGTYSIDGIYPGTYDIEISTTQGMVGSAPPAPGLPTGWNNTNEGQGPNSTGDGNADGSQSITITNADLSNIDFGINDAPVASDVTEASQVNPGGTTQVTAGAPSVTDTEDGTPTTITIKTLPTDGSVLYYNGVAVTADQVIPNFNPALLTIDPADGAVSPQYTYTTTDEAGVESNVATVTMPFECLKMTLRVYLQGALINNGGATGSEGEPLMRDNLRVSPFTSQNYIPATEPFTALPGFTHVGGGGGEMATVTAFDHSGEDAVVDWVFIELRNKLDSSEVLITRSAFVQRDGDIVDVDGLSPILWCDLPDDTYFIAVRHRNHLGVMTALAETLTINGILVDFTLGNAGLSGEFDFGNQHPLASSQYDYTGLAQKDFDGTYSCLWLGDGDQNQKVKYNGTNNDPNVTLNDVLFFPGNTNGLYNYDFTYGYYNGDYDMNSKAKYNGTENDPNLVLNQVLFYTLNSAGLYNFDFLLEQLPR